MNRIIKNLLRVTVVTLCFVCVSCWTVSAQQKKTPPSIEEITLKAVEAKVITSAEKTKIIELEQKIKKEKADLKKKNLPKEKFDVEDKNLTKKKVAEMKSLLGSKYNAWSKFRNDYIEKNSK